MKLFISTVLCTLVMILFGVIAYASPLTGDNGIGTWIVLMIVAAIVLIGLLILLLIKNKEK